MEPQLEPESTPSQVSLSPMRSVDNALKTLLLFREHEELRLSDVASQLGISHSTAHRTLAVLIRHGFARQEAGQRTYKAGGGLLDIGFEALRNISIRTIAAPHIADLALDIGETVHLAQLEGYKVRYILCSESSQPLRVGDRTGDQFLAHQTATGRCLLSDLSQDVRQELMTLALLELEIPKNQVKLEIQEIEKKITEIRDRGYSINFRDNEEIKSLAISVRNAKGRVIGSIAASGPRSRMDESKELFILRRLQVCAGRIEESLLS